MDISEVRVKLVERPSERLRAFCSITLDGDFVIRDLKIIDGSNGAFVAMPSRKLADRCRNCGAKVNLKRVVPIDGFDSEQMLFKDLPVIDTEDGDCLIGESVEVDNYGGDGHYNSMSMAEIKETAAKIKKTLTKTKLGKVPPVAVHIYIDEN